MLNTGIYGAKVQSWGKSNPRDILMTAISENRTANKAQLLTIVRDALLSDDHIDSLYAVIEYWFSNNYHSIVSQKSEDADDIKQRLSKVRSAEEEKIKTNIQAKIRDEVKIILMEMIMPSGKTLRKSTGRECAMAGGWLNEVSKLIAPDEVVGDRLTEEEISEVLRSQA